MISEAYAHEPQSMQMQLAGLGEDGEQVVADALAWIDENPEEWGYMVGNARRLTRLHGYVSAKYLCEMVRNEHCVAVPNVLSPSFSRIMESQNPELRGAFRKSRASADGFVS